MILLSIVFSFDIEEGALETLGFCVIVNLIFGYPCYRIFCRIKYIRAARHFGGFFETMDEPFVDLEKITLDKAIYYGVKANKVKSKKIDAITGAIKHGYLQNCTIEFHDGKPVVALSKQVVKDKCPHCGAPIVGVYDRAYVCKYCGSKVYGVIEKK